MRSPNDEENEPSIEAVDQFSRGFVLFIFGGLPEQR